MVADFEIRNNDVLTEQQNSIFFFDISKSDLQFVLEKFD